LIKKKTLLNSCTI